MPLMINIYLKQDSYYNLNQFKFRLMDEFFLIMKSETC